MFGIADLLHKHVDYGKEAEAAERRREAAIKTGTAAINQQFAGFDDAFYQARAKAYTDYAMPTVMGQYRTARNDIAFGLANRGLGGGSAARKQWSDLFQAKTDARRNVFDTGQSQAQALQTAVENQRNALLSNLYQSADPAAAGAGAVRTAASLREPSVFPVVAEQFQGLLNTYYYSQLINAYRPTTFIQTSPGTQIGMPGGGTSYGA